MAPDKHTLLTWAGANTSSDRHSLHNLGEEALSVNEESATITQWALLFKNSTCESLTLILTNTLLNLYIT